MADGDPRPDGERKAHVGVKHGPVLHVGVFSDDDRIVISAKYCAEPDAGVFLQYDISKNDGARSNPVFALFGELRLNVAQRVDVTFT